MPFQPYFFNDTPTVLEQLFKCIKDVLKLQKDVGDLGDFLSEVNRKIDELDKDIAQAVQNALQALIDGGDVQEMINLAVDNKLPEFYERFVNYTNTQISVNNIFNNLKENTVDFERMFRVCRDTTHFMDNQPAITDPADDNRVAHYSFAQGSCHYDEDGGGRNAIIYICNDGSKFAEGGSAYTGDGLLCVYDDAGNLIRQRILYSVVGHGQCLAYHNGYLYFQGYNPLDELSKRKLKRIRSDLVGDVEPFVLPIEFNGLSSYNGVLYIAAASYLEIDVAKVEFADGHPTGNIYDLVAMSPQALSHAGTMTPRQSTVYSAGFSVTNEYYYFGTFKPNGILKCKRFQTNGVEQSFRPLWWYAIPDMLNDEEFLTGELEGLTVNDNGDCWIYTTQHLFTKAICTGDITQVFKQNLETNCYLPLQLENEHSGRENLYVCQPEIQYFNNGNGHSSNPFCRMDELSWYINNCRKKSYFIVRIRGTVNQPLFIVNNVGVELRGADEYQTAPNYNSGGLKTTLIGNVIIYGGSIKLSNIVSRSTIHYLANKNPADSVSQNIDSYNTIKKYPIYIENAKVTILNSVGWCDNNPNTAGSFYIRDCVGVYNYTSENTIFGQLGFRNSYSNKEFLNIGSSIMNLHGDVDNNNNGVNISYANQMNCKSINYPDWYKNLITQ